MHEIHHQQELMTHLDARTSLSSIAVQGLDLTNLSEAIKRVDVDGALFMGCVISDELLCHLHRSGALVFPELPDLPFKPYRPTLYTPEELFAEFDPKEPCTYCRTPDARIYRHWHNSGRDQPDNILTTLSRRLHDHAISDGIDDFLKSVAKDRLVVAIMGGHSMERSEEAYREIARLARNMTREGFLLASGGGPGAMEATHLGAWFADREEADLDVAVAHLSQAGSYRDYDWLARAFEVKAKYPAPGENHVSLGIPTWLYGHEPPNPFATHIAKYFANSVREDGLVTIAKGGIVFAPGSAGTIQEIFQEATQNHYGSVGVISPMVFLGREYWSETKPVYPLLSRLAKGMDYREKLALVDTGAEVMKFIRDNPPSKAKDHSWSFCQAYCYS